MCKPLTSLAVVLALHFFSNASWAEPVRQTFHAHNQYLKIEILDDHLAHFEVGQGQGPSPASSIATTPQVFQKQFSEDTSDVVNPANAVQTHDTLFSIDAENLCVTITDIQKNEKLTRLCPTLGGQDENAIMQLTMSQEKMGAVYGLGEKFRKAGQPNGDWLGDVRPSGVEDGNMMTGFDGNYTADMEIPVMYALGPQNLNYALFVDQVRSQQWNFKQDPWLMQTRGQVLRFYVITGPDLPTLRQKFVTLVGKPPIPPKKAFGLWVSQYGFKSWGEVEERLAILRAKKFPVDGFVMDLDWFGGISANSPDTHMGTLTWNRAVFNDPEGHLARYRDQDGIGLILIEEPYVAQNRREFSFLKNSNTLARSLVSNEPAIFSSWFGQGGMIDWTNEKGAAAWHDLKRQPLVDMGVFGHWTDLGEPAELTTGMKYFGVDGITGDDASHMHNLFNFKWHQSIYDGYLRNKTLKRPFMISRTGTTGIERFGGALWSGDISGRITSLAAHLNAQMHISFSGIDYYGADIGGFYRLVHDGELHETYTRWLAHGAAFDVPVRPHTCIFSPADKTSPAEIGWTPSNLSNLRQRYELIPYYYSLAYRAAAFGEPVFPPPVYYYQNDVNVRELGAEKMIGRDMLVATEASQAFTTDVYLPEGDWFDYFDNVKYHAPKGGLSLKNFKLVRSALFKLPTFVRAGAILPKNLVDDQTFNSLGLRSDGKQDEAFRLQIFPAERASEFTVYEDDGATINYKSGVNAVTLVKQQKINKTFTVDIGPVVGPYVPHPLRQNIIELILEGQEQISSVKLNGYVIKKVGRNGFTVGQSGWSLLPDHHLIIKSGFKPVSQPKHFVIN